MSKDRKGLKLPSKKMILIVGAVALICVLVWLLFFKNNLGSFGEKVEFEELSKENIPNAIEREVIPEYRELERALGCVVDGKVYVIVTRGEKPTSGYGVSVKSLTMEKGEKGTNLKVEAYFKEPENGVAVSKVTTYPYVVVSTNLQKLPDSIELISQYKE
ncbi:MAG: protease complex subunit PrcB family protein [Firmicutes bacterium]|nr:protease complex subunit PrcB family protein [Bacillota bacterium]